MEIDMLCNKCTFAKIHHSEGVLGCGKGILESWRNRTVNAADCARIREQCHAYRKKTADTNEKSHRDTMDYINHLEVDLAKHLSVAFFNMLGKAEPPEEGINQSRIPTPVVTGVDLGGASFTTYATTREGIKFDPHPPETAVCGECQENKENAVVFKCSKKGVRVPATASACESFAPVAAKKTEKASRRDFGTNDETKDEKYWLLYVNILGGDANVAIKGSCVDFLILHASNRATIKNRWSITKEEYNKLNKGK